ncbi:hypothetical protein FRB95_010980 [Tulasnella sp. JGI-2019a]|nr:hypothetical protein FRB95_010980 [Tulasnella sp. JGI-2019a]
MDTDAVSQRSDALDTPYLDVVMKGSAILSFYSTMLRSTPDELLGCIVSARTDGGTHFDAAL